MKVKLKRNRHNLSHYRLGTCNTGELVPVCIMEVCPGDTFQHRCTTLVRFLPMIAPIMHRVQARVHHFFVPFRIVWDGFEDFITRQSGADPVPTFDLDDVVGGSASAQRLVDYFGIPLQNISGSGVTISKLAFAAYNMTFNEWFRDQDLVTPLEQDAAALTVSDLAVRRIAWQKDYFTSARPTPQKGPDITLPLGVSAPVSVVDVHRSDTGALLGQIDAAQTTNELKVSGAGLGALFQDVELRGSADLSSATAVTVDAVRRAFSLQRLAERLQQFGSRYPEYLASMGVKSSDARLQRPEYLGGGKVPLNFSEVLQTAEGTTTPVGEMAGHGIGPGRISPYRRFFEEHGYVISLLSIRPQSVYSTSLPRWTQHGLIDGANDFYTPELERIGQMEIYNREIFNSATNPDVVWGYNNRYSEYRYQPSQVSSDFVPGESLDYWTWARGFSAQPALNQAFIECAPPDDQIFFQSTDPNIIFGVNHHVVAQRMLTNSTIGRIL